MKDHNQSADPNDFLNDLEKEDNKPKSEKPVKKTSKNITPQGTKKVSQGQKLFLSILFFALVLIFGFFIMLITGKMVIPL